jgi:hypothetical protein
MGGALLTVARWLCRHYEAGQLLALTQVTHDHNGHGVRLTDGRGHSEAVIYYSTQQMAFEVADRLVGIRHRSHDCSPACSGWVEEHSRAEHQAPERSGAGGGHGIHATAQRSR